jgi:hypothetical protein
MRKTTVLRASRNWISLPILPGFNRIVCQSIGVITLLILSNFISIGTVQAQGPYCPNDNCTANDVQDPLYFIGNATGTPITSVVCTPGQPVTNVYLWLTFTVTATNRYDINVIGDILVDGVYDHTVNVCLGDYSSGTYTVMLEQIVWTCGSEMEVANTLFSWENNNDGNVPNTVMLSSQSFQMPPFWNPYHFRSIVADGIQAACVSDTLRSILLERRSALPYANTFGIRQRITPTPSTTSGATATDLYGYLAVPVFARSP